MSYLVKLAGLKKYFWLAGIKHRLISLRALKRILRPCFLADLTKIAFSMDDQPVVYTNFVFVWLRPLI